MDTDRKIKRIEIRNNFRDLGGYKTMGGRTVISGQLFRSDRLSDLKASEENIMRRIGILTVFDFRDTSEVNEYPDRLPEDGSVHYLNLPVTHGAFNPKRISENVGKANAKWIDDDYMIEGYKKNIDHFAKTWGIVINHIAHRKNRPVVFHCTAGKDRTGTFAALLLLLLGVPEETVIYDYELTNVYLSKWLETVHKYIEAKGADPSAFSPLLTAKRSYITALLDHIRDRYGSAETYLTTMAGVEERTVEKMKEELLL